MLPKANRLATIRPLNTVVNIGSGEEIAILDIYETIAAIFEKESNIRIEGPRAGDVKRSVLSNSRAKRYLDWQPQVSLEAGILAVKKEMKLGL
ncbi:hypothetical protein [Listeria riparia]|uniref:NAD-dependent epimerase/dehydratase n=1 Tax=Listeria riparia FSL S10-1204 TaxID=1265816 RepID=W7DAK7_9LIST|nr:hypothetical protein [Listeria riparia]EUJ42268.1 NAD-dependent epimerase/dehydratase [Listeria riparia FSL S10-1204]